MRLHLFFRQSIATRRKYNIFVSILYDKKRKEQKQNVNSDAATNEQTYIARIFSRYILLIKKARATLDNPSDIWFMVTYHIEL